MKSANLQKFLKPETVAEDEKKIIAWSNTLGSKPIELFAVVVTVSKLSLTLPGRGSRFCGLEGAGAK